MILRTADLSKHFGRVTALNTVTLEIGEGATGLLGPNGSGKTTLLRILLGLIRGSAGTAEVLGLDPQREPRAVRAQIGYMPESECIVPGLTGVDVVAFLGRLAGMPRRAALQRAHEVMYYVGLDEERYREASEYSQGMQQRLKLATALVHDPALIFLDEPTNGLDPEGRADMLEVVAELAGEHGKHIVLSSHLLRDVERVCRHVVMLEKGRVVRTGAIEEMTSDDTGTYEVRLPEGMPAYAEALRARGFTVAEGDPMLVELPADGAARLLFAVAREQGVTLRGLKPSRRSLEDVFLAEMGNGDAG
ncbi:MAG: ABC transporter ATP-binding protein [Planctomycetota bacterium]